VEDDPLLQRSLAATLREENYAVDTANDGEEAIFKADNSGYDLIVLDVMMPKLDGWQVLDHLRPQNPTPVLMLTARDTVRDRVKGLDTGADDYLTKPFDSEELLARIRALIRRNAGQTRSVIEIGPLSLDTATREARVSGTPIPLTAREYALLEYLVLHQGEIVTRTELYEHLFDEEDDSYSRLLDVHVSNLRRKLATDLIETRRGHGYLIS
ncbi:MAG: response regulator transcription factor, partial [Verrucomicrobiales bacterium]